MLKEQEHYFDRHLKLNGFGADAQNKLLEARILVIGAGGLGCPLLQYLATAGVGHIAIMDGDRINFSNLHRQILYTAQDVGHSKATIAAKKIKELYPSISITLYDHFLTVENALAVFPAYDLIIDGTDNFATRYLINDASIISKKPVVSGAIDDYVGQISVFNYMDGPTYRCLFPEEPDPEDCRSCSINGVLNVLPGIVALYMANEAIKVITNYGDVLSGKLLLIDIRINEHKILKFSLNPENKKIYTLQHEIPVLTIPELKQYIAKNPEAQLIDVREEWEFEENNIGGINIPLYDLISRNGEIGENRPLVLVCQTGKRSRMANKLLAQKRQYNVVIGRLD